MAPARRGGGAGRAVQRSPQQRGGHLGRGEVSKGVLTAIRAAEAEDTRPRLDPLTVTVPFPPSLNNAYVAVTMPNGKTRRWKSERATEFAKTVTAHIQDELLVRSARPPAPPYLLTLHIYPPMDGRKHDASNLVKIPEDALMKAIDGDDDDVMEIRVFKHAKDRQSRLEMTLQSVTTVAVARDGEMGETDG